MGWWASQWSCPIIRQSPGVGDGHGRGRGRGSTRGAQWSWCPWGCAGHHPAPPPSIVTPPYLWGISGTPGERNMRRHPPGAMPRGGGGPGCEAYPGLSWAGAGRGRPAARQGEWRTWGGLSGVMMPPPAPPRTGTRRGQSLATCSSWGLKAWESLGHLWVERMLVGVLSNVNSRLGSNYNHLN